MKTVNIIAIFILIMIALGYIENRPKINSLPIPEHTESPTNINVTSTPITTSTPMTTLPMINKENIKTMTIGDSLDIRPGYSFKVKSIDANQGQGFVLLAVYKNDVQLYEKPLYNGDVFQLESENNDVIFKATIVDVYAGTMSDMVDFELTYRVTNQTGRIFLFI